LEYLSEALKCRLFSFHFPEETRAEVRVKDRELEESEERHMMEVDNTYCTLYSAYSPGHIKI
jgi:hypothetical protein